MPAFTTETSVSSSPLLWQPREQQEGVLLHCVYSKGHEVLHGGSTAGAFGFNLFPFRLLMTIFLSLWLLQSGLYLR